MKWLQVLIEDGRIIDGNFGCLDKQGNLVLNDASQLCTDGDKRFLGTIVVPAKQRKNCLVGYSKASTA